MEQGKLHFSEGKLPLPLQFKAWRTDGDLSKVEATWQNDENLPSIFMHDEMQMVVGYADHFTSLIETGIQRKTSYGIISLPDDYDEITGV